MSENYIRAALAGVLNAPARPPALWPLAYVKYPPRELRPIRHPDGSFIVEVSLYGFEYKHRGPRPKAPPTVDAEAIRHTLNEMLPDDLYVAAAEARHTCVLLTLHEGDDSHGTKLFPKSR